MIAIQNFSGVVFLYLSLGLPLCAIGLGWYRKLRFLVVALVGQLAIMVVYLSTLYYVLETGSYPNSTGMEGLAFGVAPVIYVAVLVMSTVIYYSTAFVSRRRQANSGQ